MTASTHPSHPTQESTCWTPPCPSDASHRCFENWRPDAMTFCASGSHSGSTAQTHRPTLAAIWFLQKISWNRIHFSYSHLYNASNEPTVDSKSAAPCLWLCNDVRRGGHMTSPPHDLLPFICSHLILDWLYGLFMNCSLNVDLLNYYKCILMSGSSDERKHTGHSCSPLLLLL